MFLNSEKFHIILSCWVGPFKSFYTGTYLITSQKCRFHGISKRLLLYLARYFKIFAIQVIIVILHYPLVLLSDVQVLHVKYYVTLGVANFI